MKSVHSWNKACATDVSMYPLIILEFWQSVYTNGSPYIHEVNFTINQVYSQQKEVKYFLFAQPGNLCVNRKTIVDKQVNK